jgi:hypothetical protein
MNLADCHFETKSLERAYISLLIHYKTIIYEQK